MRKIQIYFHNTDITVSGTVLEDSYPAQVEDMWKFIETPQKCFTHHMVSTGYYLVAKPLPPYHPVPIVNQSSPLGDEIPKISNMKAGQITWRGTTWAFVYGACTEPLTSSGPVVVLVDPECMQAYHDACLNQWHQTSLHHKVGIVTISRKEN